MSIETQPSTASFISVLLDDIYLAKKATSPSTADFMLVHKQALSVCKIRNS